MSILSTAQMLSLIPELAHALSIDTSSELQAALDVAQPGDIIQLKSKIYVGQFKVRTSGTVSKPIRLIGSDQTVISGTSIEAGYGLHVTGSRWIFESLSIRQFKKGMIFDHASFNIVKNVSISNIGEEGIHFRAESTDNLVTSCKVSRTGLSDPGFGEGIYIGSAKNHWCEFSNCLPDKSDRNKIKHSTIWSTAAESIDIKEGTTGTWVENNTLDGAGLTGANSADSTIDIKGNSATILNNTIIRSSAPRSTVRPVAPQLSSSPSRVFLDALQVHARVIGWGNDTIFKGNIILSKVPGFGIWIDPKSSGAFVSCSNKAFKASRGLSNQNCE
jgi:hypothetical protein